MVLFGRKKHYEGKHSKSTDTTEQAVDLSKKVINHLKGAPVAPDHVVDLLRAAQDEPHALTGIAGDKYIACGISGAELAKNGILDDSEHTLGALYNLFNSDQVTNVTLMNDFDNYWLAIIMDQKTVDALSELDFFVDNGNSLHFEWIGIPMHMDEDDDAEDFHADALVDGDDNRITFNALCDAVEDDDKVKVVDNRIELYSRLNSDDDDVNNDEINVENSAVNNSDDDTADEQVMNFGDDDNADDVAPDAVSNTNVESSLNETVDNDDDTDVDNNTDLSNTTDIPDDDDSFDQRVSDDDFANANDDDMEAQMKSLLDVDDDVDLYKDVTGDDTLHLHLDQENADAFKRNLQSSLKAGVLNSDLQFDVNEKQFETALLLGKAPQFKLEQPKDPIDADINAFMKECNGKLNEQWKQLLNETVKGYTSDLNKIINKLLSVYSLDPNYHIDGAMTFGERKAKLDTQHQDALAHIDDEVQKETAKLDEDYRMHRLEAGEQAKTLAEREYDQDHQEELQRRKDNLRSDAQNRIDYNYNTALNDLLRQRRELANTVFDRQKIVTMNKYKDHYQNGLNKLTRDYSKMSDRLRKIVSDGYKEKVAYERAQADQANHDVKIKELNDAIAKDKVTMADLNTKHKAELQDLRVKFQNQLDNLTTEHKDELNRLDAENEQLLADLQNRLDKTLQDLRDKEEEWKQRSKNLVDEQKEQDKSVKDNLNAVIESQAKQLTALREQVDTNTDVTNKRIKHMNVVWSVITVSCGLIFGLCGNMLGQSHAYNNARTQALLQQANKNNTPQQPKIEVISPSNDSKADSHSSSQNTNSQSNSSSQSSNSNSQSHNNK